MRQTRTSSFLQDLTFEAGVDCEHRSHRSSNCCRQIDGLGQPLYYATECIDERLPEEVDKLSASRLLEVIGEIEHFLNDHTGRDSRGKIRRRLGIYSAKARRTLVGVHFLLFVITPLTT